MKSCISEWHINRRTRYWPDSLWYIPWYITIQHWCVWA